jgi:hypothetical protein
MVGASGVDTDSLLRADNVLPMDVGGVISAAATGEETNMEPTDRDEEVVVVESTIDESLSTESKVLLLFILGLVSAV